MASVTEKYRDRSAFTIVDANHAHVRIHRTTGILSQEDLPVGVFLTPVNPDMRRADSRSHSGRLQRVVSRSRAAHQQLLQIRDVILLHRKLPVALAHKARQRRTAVSMTAVDDDARPVGSDSVRNASSNLVHIRTLDENDVAAYDH